MTAQVLRSRWLRLAFDPLLALGLAGATGFAMIAMPRPLLETLIVRLHVSGLIPQAAPPLGETARLMVAGAAALGMGITAWVALWLAGRVGSIPVARSGTADIAPALRRADAHPDAPARRPIFATLDLGKSLDEGAIEIISKGWPAPAPFVEATSDDAPVEAFIEDFEHPIAVPEERVAETSRAPEPVAPPEPEIAAPAPVRSFDDASVASLMARLEAGLGKLEAKDPTPSAEAGRLHADLRDTLDVLRPLARGAR